MTYDECKQQFLELLPQYIGYGRVLSQADLDQGDSLQRMGTLYTLLTLINDPELTNAVQAIQVAPIGVLEDGCGIWSRSNNLSFWGSDVRCTSRDQLSIAKIALATMPEMAGSKRMLWDTFKAQMKRLTFHQNYYDVLENRYHIPDPMIPFEASVYLRAFLGKYSKVATWFFDLGLGVDMMLRNASDLNKWSADNMLAVSLLYAKHRYPNFVTRWLMRKYLKTDFMARLWNYHRTAPDNNGCEPLYYLYKMAFIKLEGYNG